MKKYIALGVIATALMSSSAFAVKEGGGGDPLALEFKATAEKALKNLQSLKKFPFSRVNVVQLQNKIDAAQILVSNSALPISEDGVTQDGAAENEPNLNLIVINRANYSKIGSAATQQALALHEYLSLMGVESTGNYPISGAYLIAQSGGTSGSASKTISSTSANAEGSTLSLQDGLYATASGFCSEQVVNDESSGDLILEGVYPCSAAGRVYNFTRVSSNRFSDEYSYTVTAWDVQKCTPTSTAPTPCASAFYDSNAGALLLQAGDVISNSQTVTVLNSTAFEISPDSQDTWSRNGAVIGQGSWSWPIGAGSSNNGTTVTILYTLSQ